MIAERIETLRKNINKEIINKKLCYIERFWEVGILLHTTTQTQAINKPTVSTLYCEKRAFVI